MKFLLTIDCNNPSFLDGAGEPDEAKGLIDILQDVQALIQSGTPLMDLHGERIRGLAGDQPAVILCSKD